MKAKRQLRRTTGSAIVSRAGGLPTGYKAFLDDLKARIRSAQVRAGLAVNRELIQLYWDIGRAIVARQHLEGWGSGVIDRLAADIQKAFPGIEGFSPSNVSRMRAFFLAWAGGQVISAQAVPKRKRTLSARLVPKPAGSLPPAIVTQIPWGHNVVLLFQLHDRQRRVWYAQQAVVHGWSRNVLVHWIESDLYARQGKAVTNFSATLPPLQSDLAQQVLRDPYSFDFLTLHADAAERELEQGLLEHIARFLLELGAGFAFVGRQVHVEVDGEDFYLDLLFYHLHLRCFIVIDLKTGRFKPEYAGKMNFYLSAVDDQMRRAGDGPSIGLILCKTRSRVIAEYALRQLQRPVGVARYVTKLTEQLPRELAGKLPSVREIEAELIVSPLRKRKRS
jgi:predicted nuclease of restriction endonuclease-like (RecB) superfamily